MTCFMCKGNLADKETTFFTDLGNCIIIIKNVPSQVCTQCGEVSYSNEVAHRIESIINELRNSMSEITVVNYNSKSAA